MYFPYFITYMAIGVVIGLLVFVWAMKTGQFKDQQRARFLPLEEDAQALPVPSKFNRLEAYVLILLVVLGLSATAAVLIFALTTSPESVG